MRTEIQNGVLTAIADEGAYLTQKSCEEGTRCFWKTIGVSGVLDNIRDATAEEKEQSEMPKIEDDECI